MSGMRGIGTAGSPFAIVIGDRFSIDFPYDVNSDCQLASHMDCGI
jgi:hypothetical protein